MYNQRANHRYIREVRSITSNNTNYKKKKKYLTYKDAVTEFNNKEK